MISWKQRTAVLFLLPFLLLFLFGCTGSVVKDAQVQDEEKLTVPIYREQGPNPGVFFCKQDNCSGRLEELLSSARNSIHCAFYDLDLENIVSVLKEKSSQVDVKVVLDDEPYEGILSGPGVLLEDKSSRMHNKFCVVDGMYVWTGSFNPTFNDNSVNDNNGVLMSSYYLAQNYEQEFSELWKEEFSGGNAVTYPTFFHNAMKVENAFCPEDGCEEFVAQRVSEAKTSVYGMVFSFTSEKIADAMLFNPKIEVNVVFDSSQAGSKYSQFHRLGGFGIPVKKDKGKGKLHHKVFIIDNSTIITGSYNPTASGSERNDENILILHDEKIARQYAEEFFRLWKLSYSVGTK